MNTDQNEETSPCLNFPPPSTQHAATCWAQVQRWPWAGFCLRAQRPRPPGPADRCVLWCHLHRGAAQKLTADLFLLHVPYRGTGPMMTDLLSGRLEASAVGAAAMLPFIKSGKVRCIATGSAKRLPQLPDVPTVAEQGFPGFEMTQWYGMLAPANMPAANLEKLSVETMKAVKAPPRWNGSTPTQPKPLAVRLRSLPSSSPQSRDAGRRYCCAPRSSQTEHSTDCAYPSFRPEPQA